MSKCPVCQTDYIEGQVECCPSCGWDLTPYPPTIGHIPGAFLEKERGRLTWIRSLWGKFNAIGMELDGTHQKLTEICREKRSVEADKLRIYQEKETLEVELNDFKEQLEVKETLLEELEGEGQSVEADKLRIYQEKEALEVKLNDLKEQLEVKETLLEELEGKGQSLEVEKKSRIIAEISDLKEQLKAKETLLADIEEKLSLKNIDTKLTKNWEKRHQESRLTFLASFILAIVSISIIFTVLVIALFQKSERIKIIIMGGVTITNLVGSSALYVIHRKADWESRNIDMDLIFQKHLNDLIQYANENISNEDKRTEFISMVWRDRDKFIQDNRGQILNRNRNQLKDQQVKDRNN